MAQSTLHFAAGMTLGSLLACPRVYRAWTRGTPVARAIARWCLLAYGLGLYATLPAVFRRLTGDPATGSAFTWNLFLLYPLFDRLRLPSIALGEMAIATLFSLQYVVILAAVRRARRRNSAAGTSSASVSASASITMRSPSFTSGSIAG